MARKVKFPQFIDTILYNFMKELDKMQEVKVFKKCSNRTNNLFISPKKDLK